MSGDQRHVGRQISRAELRPGDIVWTPGHVAIYSGDGRIIEAARLGSPSYVVREIRMWQGQEAEFVRITGSSVPR